MDRTALHWAAQLGLVQVAQQLLVAAAATAATAAADMAAAAAQEGMAAPEFPALTELQVLGGTTGGMSGRKWGRRVVVRGRWGSG